MTDINTDPRYHIDQIREQMQALLDQLRRSVVYVTDARTQLLFETTAEVVRGLVNEYEHFAQQSGSGWPSSVDEGKPGE